jgi:hypothetical protein
VEPGFAGLVTNGGGLKPTTQTFNNLLQALSQSGSSGASDAFDFFLQANSENQSWALDTVSFNTSTEWTHKMCEG